MEQDIVRLIQSRCRGDDRDPGRRNARPALPVAAANAAMPPKP
jgi:hypothetical protein